MRNLLIIGLFLASIGFYLPAQVYALAAPPPLWDDNFGGELRQLTGCDDCEQRIPLRFPFPFNGNTYSTAYVGTNGCIQLAGLGLDEEIDYDYWQYMEEFLSDSDPDNPIICPIDTDWDLSTNGKVYYNSRTNPAVITWYKIGTNEDEETMSSFQALLYVDGTIVFNFNGILDGPDQDLIDDLDDGIVVGVTPSDLPWNGEPFVPGDPGPVDLNQGVFNFGPTAYERWCYDDADSCGVDGEDTGLPGPENDEFDLDFQSVCFTPQNGEFEIISAAAGNTTLTCGGGELVVDIPTLSEWGMMAMAGVLGLVGFMAIRRKKLTA